MSEANVAVVRSLFELYASGGIEAAIEVADEDIVIVIHPDVSAEPDTYRGHEGIRRYFAGFEGMLEDVRYEAFELIDEGQHVLAVSSLAGRGVSSGLEVELKTVVVHTVEGGKITRIEPFTDLESAREALR